MALRQAGRDDDALRAARARDQTQAAVFRRPFSNSASVLAVARPRRTRRSKCCSKVSRLRPISPDLSLQLGRALRNATGRTRACARRFCARGRGRAAAIRTRCLRSRARCRPSGDFARAAEIYRRMVAIDQTTPPPTHRARHLSARAWPATRKRSSICVRRAVRAARRCSAKPSAALVDRPAAVVSGCGRAMPRARSEARSPSAALALGRAEFPAVDTGFLGDRISADHTGECISWFDNVSNRLANQVSRLTGRHCATGVPFGRTPVKAASCQCAGKCTQLSR